MAGAGAGPESTIGGRIAQARFRLAAKRGRTVTQAWLAERAGVSGPTVSQWESGVTEPSLASLRKIAAALGVSPGYLAFGDESDRVPEPVPEGADVLERLTPAVTRPASEIVSKAAAKKPGKRKRAG
jgi:transcriptional regulator with XRE-family HTH domain